MSEVIQGALSHGVTLVEAIPILGAARADAVIVGVSVLGLVVALTCRICLGRVQGRGSHESVELLDVDTPDHVQVLDLQRDLRHGAKTYLHAQTQYNRVLILVASVGIFTLLGFSGAGLEYALFSVIAFVWGAAASMLNGHLGVNVVMIANGGTLVQCAGGYGLGFRTAFQGGIAMGCGLAVLGLLNLYLCFMALKLHFKEDPGLFGVITAFGLGGSMMTLFGRVGAGIFTQASNVGSNLAGKALENGDASELRNPGVVADCLGDGIGGIGTEFFASFSEAACAALVIASTVPDVSGQRQSVLYPLLVVGVGHLACLATFLFREDPRSGEQVIPVLRKQLWRAALLASVVQVAAAWLCLPHSFEAPFVNGHNYTVKWWYCALTVVGGIWGGLALTWIREYYTSNSHLPVKELAESCDTGVASNILSGLALGQRAAVFPSVLLGLFVYVGYNLCGMIGIALGALGMLCTLCMVQAVHGYGCICEHASHWAELAHMDRRLQLKVYGLDSARSTADTISKGYTTGAAALVSIALYGAFLTKMYGTGVIRVNMIDPRTLFGLITGGMLPCWFAAATVKSVDRAAVLMVKQIQYQFRMKDLLGQDRPDYDKCVKVVADASMEEMVNPAALLVLGPLICGVLFGKETLTGLLPGAIMSGIQIGMSYSTSGGAWDSARKYIEAGGLGAKRSIGSKEHAVAVIGGTMGDPMKDTYGPALNVAMKLMAITSLVFLPVFTDPRFDGVLFDQLGSRWAVKDA